MLLYHSYYISALCLCPILIYVHNATDQMSVSVKLTAIANCVRMFKQNNVLKIILII